MIFRLSYRHFFFSVSNIPLSSENVKEGLTREMREPFCLGLEIAK
jgi:hypothetical protein